MRWRPVRAQRSVGQGHVQAGLWSREINAIGVPTPSQRAEGHIAGSARRELPGDPARSKNHGMYGISMRENREIPWSPAPQIEGRAARGRLRPHARDARRGKSYCLVVPAKPPNKNARGEAAHTRAEAEAVEERGQAKGSLDGVAPTGLSAGKMAAKCAGTKRDEPRAGTGEAVKQPPGCGLDRQGNSGDRLDARPEAGTQCGSSARWGLCGGRGAILVPTATQESGVSGVRERPHS